MTSDEDIIRDLAFGDLSQKQRSLEYLNENWKIDYRPYIWLAIENEEDDVFQAKLVKLVVNKLEDKSLRKLIRYAESDILSNRSLIEFISGYVNYESDEVREALIKSLKRPKSSTIKFLAKMFSRREIAIMSKSRLNSLLDDLCSQELPDDYIIAISRNLSALLGKKIRSEISQLYLINNFSYSTAFILGILDGIEIEKYLWFSIRLGNRYWSEVSLPFKNSIDAFLIKSCLHVDSRVRAKAIELLSLQYSSKMPDNGSILLDDIIDGISLLILYKAVYKFLEFENYIKGISSVIIKRTNIELDEEIDDDEEDSLYKIPIGFEADDDRVDHFWSIIKDPEVLSRFIIFLLPVMKLVDLANNDPVAENRQLAYSGLTNIEFWKIDDLLVGPALFWSNTIIQAIKQIKNESDKALISQILDFLVLLLDLIRQSDGEIRNQIKNKLLGYKILDHTQDEKFETQFLMISYLLIDLIEGKTPNVIISDSLQPKYAEIIISDMLTSNSENLTYSLIEIFKLKNTSLKLLLLNIIEEFIGVQDINHKLAEVLTFAEKDDDVRIRSLARLLKQKL